MEKYLESYRVALALNSSNHEKWRKYLDDLTATRKNLLEYLKERSNLVMIPMGKKAFVKGKVVHTNEVTVCHGSTMFSDVSSAQAIEIIESRMDLCKEQLQKLEKECELLTNNSNVAQDVFPASGKLHSREIIEECNEELEEEWRRKHRESVRRQKLKEAEERKMNKEERNVNQILQDYELMEELASELESLKDCEDDTLARLMSGELKLPETKKRIAHSSDEKKNVSPDPSPQVAISLSEAPIDNDLVAQNNQEIVDLLKNYRSKINNLLRGLKKDDDRNLNLFLDLNELREDIEDDIRNLNDEECEESSDASDRDSDDETTASVVSIEPEERKRKVRFSASLEDVKVIESKQELEEEPNPTKENTIQIHFKHSPAKQYHNDSFENIITDPSEIFRKFTRGSDLESSTSRLEIKSILKNKVTTEVPETFSQKPTQLIYQSDVIIGDVYDRNQKLEDEIIQVASKQTGQKKVSKFKQLRAKS